MTVDKVLLNFIDYLYEKKLYDSRTWEITCASPWVDAGYKQWGLGIADARCLRSILIQRAAAERDVLFDYNRELRCWHVDMHYYPNRAAAWSYFKTRPITQSEWVAAMADQRDLNRVRVEKARLGL